MNPEGDLSLTIKELSCAYEELSLLYRVSEGFSLLSVDDICEKIADEAVSAIGVRTAAVLFLDEKKEKLYTKAHKGNWDHSRELIRDDGIIWTSIEARRPSVMCRITESSKREYLNGISSLMVCPLAGKAKEIGAIVIADKEEDEEFYSNDTKLLMAIAAQAGLAIENAFLYQELEMLLLGAIGSLVRALEASSYWTAGHTERVTEYSLGIGKVLGLEKELIEKLKICSLLHDIGKIATPKEILNKKGSLEEEEWTEIKKHPELGADILVDLKQFEDITMSIKYHHEHWDGGGGIFGLKRDEIPLMARILAVADAFDAMTSDRPYRRMKSKEEAVTEISRCSGSQFDPVVVGAFLSWVNDFSPPR